MESNTILQDWEFVDTKHMKHIKLLLCGLKHQGLVNNMWLKIKEYAEVEEICYEAVRVRIKRQTIAPDRVRRNDSNMIEIWVGEGKPPAHGTRWMKVSVYQAEQGLGSRQAVYNRVSKGIIPKGRIRRNDGNKMEIREL